MKTTSPKKKKNRLINYLVISLIRMLLSRTFCQKSGRVNIRYQHTVSVVRVNFSFSLGKNFVKSIYAS